MFESVVVGVRGEEAGRDAIALAKELTSPHGEITLHYVQVVTKPAIDSGSVGDAAERRYALERLRALADESQIDARVSCADALSPRAGLHDVASNQRADLLIVSASHRDELGRDFVGDDTREVLDDPPCVVAVAPAGYAVRAGGVRRIGVAYDGSRGSDEALTAARNFAAERRAELSAFDVVSAPVAVGDPWDVREQFEVPVEEARQRLAALADVESHVAYGDAIEELARYAGSVDLLVVGSHKYGPIDRLVQQTTAQRLADEASSPLLVLPSAAPSGR